MEVKKINYRIYFEWTRRGLMKRLVRKHVIRVDIFGDFPLWKVPELLKCKNWRIRDSNKGTLRKTYYIDIL